MLNKNYNKEYVTSMWHKSKYFKKKELDCKCGCGYNATTPELLNLLNVARAILKQPIRITSGSRCLEYNRKVGSRDNSAHVKGTAVDIACSTSRLRFKLMRILMNRGVTRFGVSTNFIHMDIEKSLPSNVIWTYTS